MIAERDEDTSAAALHFAIEDRVEDRIVALDVLNQQDGTEAEGGLEILSKMGVSV